ncbi:hypothetical protein [Halogeometricum luteum]|uniref:Uncharacterized protein n=1 Tax=Halogeometricum luteum TaxID=2950537 RepID=A0ABU2G4T4_9EURY|nr:hypothetical protein [Halogeometricum sp. S3BR5-2]MDS0295799.1 hypothetical protein [Halogeometricum sp. S3BR5-2]
MSSPVKRPDQAGEDDGRLGRVLYAAFWALFGVGFLALGLARGLTLVGLAFVVVGAGGFVLAGYSLVAPPTAIPTTDVFSRRADGAPVADSRSVLAAYALAVVLLGVALVLVALWALA